MRSWFLGSQRLSHSELSNVRCTCDSRNCWGLVSEISVVFEESNPCCDDLTDGFVGEVLVDSRRLPVVDCPLTRRLPVDCPLSNLLFGAALAAGWPWALSLRLFAGLRRGRAGEGGAAFIPERGKCVAPHSSWLAGTLVSVVVPSVSATIFFDTEGVVFVRCSHAVFGSADQLHGQVPA